jgi:hypothetical protein
MDTDKQKKRINEFFNAVVSGNIDIRINYLGRLLDHLEIFVNQREAEDRLAISNVRLNLITTFNHVIQHFADCKGTIPQENVSKIEEIFSQKAIVLDSSWGEPRALYGSQTIKEIYALIEARKCFDRAVKAYALYLAGDPLGFSDATKQSDIAIRIATEICNENNIYSKDDQQFKNLSVPAVAPKQGG